MCCNVNKAFLSAVAIFKRLRNHTWRRSRLFLHVANIKFLVRTSFNKDSKRIKPVLLIVRSLLYTVVFYQKVSANIFINFIISLSFDTESVSRA